MKQVVLPLILGLFVAVSLMACQQTDTPATTTSAATPPTDTMAPQEPEKQTPPTKKPEIKAAKDDVAVIETNLGRIVLEFLLDKAPGHVQNFENLARDGFYDGTKFHRVIPGFMIQGGDPNSKDDNRADDGTGGPGYSVKAEFNDTPHVRGIVSMARSNDPDSAGSQFFIVVKDSNFLDNKYTVFGRVLEGMDIADKIVALKRDENDNPLPENPAVIKSVKIMKKSELKK